MSDDRLQTLQPREQIADELQAERDVWLATAKRLHDEKQWEESSRYFHYVGGMDTMIERVRKGPRNEGT